ncbi:protein of unknown function [Vibrio tapetis subsp. tapetis]|uniref:Uncharacterized protein n=1 Tax=Vibrio tapetis subsp. tapetis TaxID=1671868 RepID=A0A2N8ZE98_9VIBR|nr:protein of unknown function [Vibrio tapetis subsp. tapetis]
MICGEFQPKQCRLKFAEFYHAIKKSLGLVAMNVTARMEHELAVLYHDLRL